VGHLDRVGVAELMQGDAPPDAGGGCRASQLDADG
jgi:hypothetical protein